MGCHIMTIRWKDEKDGVDESMWGFKFVQGIMIFLTKTSVETLVHHKDEIDMTIIDDVSLSKFFENRIELTQLGTVLFNDTGRFNDTGPALCYRNRINPDNDIRKDDITRMNIIVDQLLEEQA